MGKFSDLEPTVRVAIKKKGQVGGSAFGSGVAQLCRGVLDMGSLNRAAKSMGMSYSKAWRIMRETEAKLGFSLLDRDGARGSTLTDDGRRLLDCYESLQQHTLEDAQGFFADSCKG